MEGQTTTDSDCPRVRSFDPRYDLPGVFELIAEVAKLDGVTNDPWLHVLRTQLDVPGHDSTRDRWVAEVGNPPTLVAQALLVHSSGDTKADVDVVVHPSYRRRGIGGTLLDQALRRAREIGVERLSLFAREDDPATYTFLRRRGFTPDGVYTEMRLPAEVPVERPSAPPGYQIRSFDTIGEVAVLVEAMNNCYEGLWGHRATTEAELAPWIANRPHDGTFVAFGVVGDIAGVVRAEIRETTDRRCGFIDDAGIAPPHRGGMELRRTLLLNALSWLRAHGCACVTLEAWGNIGAPLSLYAELGFTVARQNIAHHLDI